MSPVLRVTPVVDAVVGNHVQLANQVAKPHHRRGFVDDQPHGALFGMRAQINHASLEAAIGNGWLDRERVVMESLQAIKRAGADLILTYYADRFLKVI